jgi:CubicO group peptidase (beta-lactamase class C family)
MLTRRQVLLGAAALALAACGDNDNASDSSPASTSTTSGTSTTSTTTSGPTTSTSAPASSPVGRYYPPAEGTWETIEPAAAGWERRGIDAVVEYVGGANTTTFLMLSGGRVLAEHYFGGATASTLQDIASAQKPVTSTLVGIAQAQGKLHVDDTITSHLGPGWSRAAPAEEAPITVRHLMTMTSGLNPRTLRKKTAPGAVWDYNTDAYQRLRKVLEKVTGMGIDALTRSSIFDRIGVSSDTRWVERGEADAMGDKLWGIRSTARDLARFGLLAARLGRWEDTQVVSEAWLREAWTSIPQKVDYGDLWWLLGKGHLRRVGAPPDLVAGLGAQDQKVYVSPSLDLVVVRQGTAAKEASEAESDFDGQLVKRIVAARL